VIASGQKLTEAEHENCVNRVAFSPTPSSRDSERQEEAPVWEIPERAKIVHVKHQHRVSGVAFSPDGRQVATANDDEAARVWEIPSGRKLTQVERPDWVNGVASPDRRGR
jgi:WD40 repeat protein